MTSATVVERAAIVNDDADEAQLAAELAKHLGYDPVVVGGGNDNAPRLAESIGGFAKLAILDHKLSKGGFASFTGATLAEELYRRKVPPVLMTSFMTQVDHSIRQHRRFIPSLIKTGVSIEALRAAVVAAKAEVIDGTMSAHRMPHKTFLVVEAMPSAANGGIVEARVPAWDESEVVGFPLELIPEDLRSRISPEVILIAQINVDADDRADLYFTEFEFPDQTPSE